MRVVAGEQPSSSHQAHQAHGKFVLTDGRRIMMDWESSGRHGAWMVMIWTVSRTQVFSIAEFRSALGQRSGKKKLQWAGADA
jgi:hypothetical protein